MRSPIVGFRSRCRGVALGLPAVLLVASGLAGCGSSGALDDGGSFPGEVPSGAPPAAFSPPALLPEPAAWPFRQGAPGLSGSGRYAWGAYYWSDFLYDAHGAAGGDPPADHYGSPTGGGMRYPDEPGMSANGADLFRLGIGADSNASYWRVDWMTLADGNIPIAAFGLDYTEGGLDAATAWPGVPRLRAAGVDAVLLISAAGYRLLAADGSELATGATTVNLPSLSFVARLPRSVLPVGGQWAVRMVTGLHDGNGGFRDEMPLFGGPGNAPPVFNVAFRDYSHETIEQNFWRDSAQSQALAQGDVTAFAGSLDWSRLNRGRAEPEATPTGFINRWYVSSIDPMSEYGRVGIDQQTAIAGGHPVFLDKVQPYSLYVPTSYAPGTPAPVTLTLHSGSQMHNQYGVTMPNFTADACEARGAFCLSTEGRGPAGDFEGDAELDLWEAWADVARRYTLDADRVHSSGYSMGGNSTLRLLMKYPDIIAGGIVIAGGDDRVIDLRLMPNLYWSGYYHAHGTFDQMVPFPEARAIADELKNLGYQYVFDHYQNEDHVAWALRDMQYPAFTHATQWLTDDAPATPKRNPGFIAYNWFPAEVNERLGVGPAGPWWLEELQATDGAELATIRARSGGRPERRIEEVVFSEEQLPTPSPHNKERQDWVLGAAPAEENALGLELGQVRQLGIDLVGAGMEPATSIELTLANDVPVRLILRRGGDTRSMEFPAGDTRLIVLDAGSLP